MADTPQKLSDTIHVFGTTKGGGTGKKPKVSKPSDSKYAAPKRVKGDDAKKLEDVRKKIAKNADKATTASGEIGKKDLPGIIKQVDPQNTAQVIPEMYQQMQMMLSLLSMGSGSGGGGGGSGGGGGGDYVATFDSMPSGISVVINDSFTGALAILTRKYGFEEVIRVFDTALYDGGAPGDDYGVDNLDPLYKNIVLNSLANLIRLALYFGPLNIPISQYDGVKYGDIVPDNVVDEDVVPDFYLKVYYTLDDDPYPGYQEWISQDGLKTKVYTKKDPKSYHFSTMNEEIYSTSEMEIAADLDPYFQYIQTGERTYYYTFLTSKILNDILYKQMVNIENNTLNAGLGNNAAPNFNSGSGGGGGGGAGMAGMLGGLLMQLMQMLTSEQLPNSKIEGSTVLPQGEIQNMMQQFQKDMGLNNQIFELGKGILGGGGLGGMMGGSPLGMLNGMGGIGNIMGGFGLDGGGLGGVLGGMGLGSLMGGFGSFGGGSGGGGGGAGSGFGAGSGVDGSGVSYDGGSYTGGEISPKGLSNIQSLLQKLGIEP